MGPKNKRQSIKSDSQLGGAWNNPMEADNRKHRKNFAETGACSYKCSIVFNHNDDNDSEQAFLYNVKKSNQIISKLCCTGEIKMT